MTASPLRSLVRPRFPGDGRRLELALIAGGLLLAAFAGMTVASLSSQFGAAKVLWVALVAVGATIALSSLRTAVAVLILALAFPFRTKLLFGLDVHTTQFLMLLIAALGLLAMSLDRLRRPPRGMVVAALLITVSSAVGALSGPDLGPSLFREFNGPVLALIVALVTAAALEPSRDMPRLVLVSSVALGGASLVALGQAVGKVPASIAPTFDPQRVNGLFLHPNILAGYLVAGILLLVGSATYAWRRIPFAALVVLPSLGLAMAALLVTQSRGALLALVAGTAVVMGLMAARRRALAVVSILLVVGLGLLAIVPRVPESERAQFAARFQKLQQPGAESGRQLIYRAARQQIRLHPITGVGTLEFGRIMRQRSTVPGLEPGLSHAHNVFFEAWLSLGLVGLLALGWLFFGACRRLLLATRLRPGDDPIVAGWAVGALGALTSMFVQGMVDMVFWQIEMLVLLFVLIASAYAIDRERHEAPPSLNP